jgi:lysophospholipase L1-like esterase
MTGAARPPAAPSRETDAGQPDYSPYLVVLGDSVAQGQGDPAPGGGWCGYAGRLAAALGLSPGQHHNVAAAGATWQSVAYTQLRQVRHTRPALVVLGCGMNDALSGFDLQELAVPLATTMRWSTVAAATVVVPVPVPPLINVAPMSQRRRQQVLERIETANEILRLQCVEYGALLLGPQEGVNISDTRYWSDDGIHLNSAGHTVVAQALALAVRDRLASPAQPPSQNRIPS